MKRNPGGWTVLGVLLLLGVEGRAAVEAAEASEPLTLSVYATADDVLRHLAPAEQREATLAKLRPLRVTRVFLEGRRGDEYVPPAVLQEVRDHLASQGIRASGGIATVPGAEFGVRQNEGLGWLNWESEKTRQGVARFFQENAPIFDELIVDDFFCTGDTSAASDQARGGRSWSEYRRDLLVSLVEPLMVGPARAANPKVRMIIKFPQWYDRFHLFGYDPARMAARFEEVWVGTEVRNPQTRRMGFVQPTEGYMNFRWLSSVAGGRTRGAWFDHIECTAANVVDQAYQSVLAGARELTLFRLGDVVADHPGDALLAERWPELVELAGRIRGRDRRGLAYYKPPNSEAADNLYLMDYLGMIGWPVLPESRYPEEASHLVLGAQAAADPEILGSIRRHLQRGATLVMTPAFLRRAGGEAQRWAGVRVGGHSEPGEVHRLMARRSDWTLTRSLEVDRAVAIWGAQTRVTGMSSVGTVPFLTERRIGRGRVLVLNTRTFSEDDFRSEGEWLLSPKERGLPALPQEVADQIRGWVGLPGRLELKAPAGVGLYLWDGLQCLYNFHEESVRLELNDREILLKPHHLWRK